MCPTYPNCLDTLTTPSCFAQLLVVFNQSVFTVCISRIEVLLSGGIVWAYVSHIIFGTYSAGIKPRGAGCFHNIWVSGGAVEGIRAGAGVGWTTGSIGASVTLESHDASCKILRKK